MQIDLYMYLISLVFARKIYSKNSFDLPVTVFVPFVPASFWIQFQISFCV